MAPLVVQPLERWERLITDQARVVATRPVTLADHEARTMRLAHAAAMCFVTVYVSRLGWACIPGMIVLFAVAGH